MQGKKHSVKNSHSQSWGSWSDWIWEHAHQKYYRQRIDWQGQIEYQWENEVVATHEHQRTPRTEATIDQLTNGFNDLHVNESGYDQNQDNAYSEQCSTPVNHSTPDVPASPLYTHDAYYRDGSGYSPSHLNSYEGKGKAIVSNSSHNLRYDEGYSQIGSVPPAANSYSQYGYPQHDTGFEQEDYEKTTGNSYYHQQDDHASTDYELQKALQLSKDELLGNSRAGGASSSGNGYDPGSIYSGTYDLNPNGPGDNETTPRGTPLPTRSSYVEAPSPGTVDNSVIRGTPGSAEAIDPRFIVESSYKFQPGEVFKILWSEPTGQVAGDAPISDIRTMPDLGRNFYIGYRRFIIVSTDESHHSTCVPILTYDRRGCGKKGVRPSKHGIIYAVGQKPKLLRNEPELGFSPVPLDIYAEGETLARESRVNYSKLVTIEHNVKVFFIGRVPYPYFDEVSIAVDKCWNDKMQKPSKKSRR
ncbi:hypothetical protein F4808DRAFT_469971 [Astrocystis sublimbata]|nr:hypothetical protein F4808DRAFT_469971 [Astrocystis sublimbata]